MVLTPRCCFNLQESIFFSLQVQWQSTLCKPFLRRKPEGVQAPAPPQNPNDRAGRDLPRRELVHEPLLLDHLLPRPALCAVARSPPALGWARGWARGKRSSAASSLDRLVRVRRPRGLHALQGQRRPRACAAGQPAPIPKGARVLATEPPHPAGLGLVSARTALRAAKTIPRSGIGCILRSPWQGDTAELYHRGALRSP